MSVGQYINYKKLAQAVMDLRYTNLPIIQVALKNGFSTQESFTRAVKKAFHVTPSQFRRHHMWSEEIEEKLVEVLEETSHETARQERVELPKPRIELIRKPQSSWYYIARNELDLFPHQFYVQCEKEKLNCRLHEISKKKSIGGAYLTHIYQKEKFTSLTLGIQVEQNEERVERAGGQFCLIPESDYLLVNVPPYYNYELGAHVLAAWNVFSEFDYARHHLQRDLDHAPIYEWNSKQDGYTLLFPVRKILEDTYEV